jgi:transcriptional regulator with XRE-family HTH domain
LPFWYNVDGVSDDEGDAYDALVGANVRRYRTAKGLSQADLAAALSAGGEHVHQTTVLKIEKGTRPLRFSEAVRISEALGISPAALAEQADDAKENADFLRRFLRITKMEARLQDFAAELTTVLVDCAGWLDSQENSGARRDRVYAARQLLKKNWGDYLNEELQVRGWRGWG